MDTIEVELNEVRGNQADFVSPEDIANLKEQILVKVDRYELNKLYDVKSNKEDIKLLINAIDYVHKQLEFSTQVSLSAVRGLSLKDDGEHTRNHKNILLKQATTVATWISSQNVNECIKFARFEIPKDFDNYAQFASIPGDKNS